MTPIRYPFKIKKVPTSKKVGEIFREIGRTTNKDEDFVATTLVKFGYNITFLRETNIPHMHTPDCW